MAKFPIPIHVAKTEDGLTKIITGKKRVEELGVNAFIVSKATANKLREGPPAIDYEGLAQAAAAAVLAMPACVLPANPAGVIRKAMIEASNG